MPYRINSRQLFLTYPQCNISKEVASTLLLNLLENYEVEEYIVAHELHQNGDDHLHAYFKLKNPVNRNDPHWADLHFDDASWHGNYQGCRSRKNVMKYCTKKEDYISNIDVEAVIAAKNVGKRKIIAEELINKKRPLVDIIEEYPELIFEYKRLKENIDIYWKDKEDERGSLPLFLPNPWGRVLFRNKNGKKRHYWIFSRMPNLGKTYHFAQPLYKDYKVAMKSGDFTYWNLRGDENAIILDEYNSAQLKYNYINSMCDGSCEYRIFQGGVKRLINPLIIILSNQSIVDLYPNMNSLLYARFNEIEL